MDLIRLYPGGFPLTVERLEFLQTTYTKARTQLTKIAGAGNLIIEGVNIDTGNNPDTVSAGIVVLDGEIMEFRASDLSALVGIFETVTNVPYNEDINPADGNLDQKPSDIVRYARCVQPGDVEPSESFDFSSLVRINTIVQNSAQVGDIKMIYRAYNVGVDLGWSLCDGTNGTPDMRDRFPAGAVDPNTSVGETGGLNEVTLTAAQGPIHNHAGTAASGGSHTHPIDVRNGVMRSDVSVAAGGEGNDDTQFIENVDSPNGVTEAGGSHSHTINIANSGSGESHENRPPFVKFNFLMFTGF
jgi:microcystin-dependent protein